MIKLPDDEKWVPGYEGSYALAEGGLSVISYKRNKRRTMTWSKNNGGYLQCSLNMPGLPLKKFSLHRAVYIFHYGPIPEGMCIDHIDRDTSNNSVENLREATKSQNGMNSKKKASNTSGVPGVSWAKHANKWQAHISIDGVNTYLGLFESLPAAELEVIAARRKYHDKFAKEHPFDFNRPFALAAVVKRYGSVENYCEQLSG